MPGPTFVSDKCQEDKCLDHILFRTNARRTNAWTHYWFGQMPGPTLFSDKCQEDKCLTPHFARTNARRTMPEPTGPGICPLSHLSAQAFVPLDICPLQMPVEAFVHTGRLGKTLLWTSLSSTPARGTQWLEQPQLLGTPSMTPSKPRCRNLLRLANGRVSSSCPW